MNEVITQIKTAVIQNHVLVQDAIAKIEELKQGDPKALEEIANDLQETNDLLAAAISPVVVEPPIEEPPVEEQSQ